MPIYEYECPACGESEEIMLKLEELDDPVHCIVCQSECIRVCGNKGGFRLDGSGWSKQGYATHLGDARKFEEK